MVEAVITIATLAELGQGIVQTVEILNICLSKPKFNKVKREINEIKDDLMETNELITQYIQRNETISQSFARSIMRYNTAHERIKTKVDRMLHMNNAQLALKRPKKKLQKYINELNLHKNQMTFNVTMNSDLVTKKVLREKGYISDSDSDTDEYVSWRNAIEATIKEAENDVEKRCELKELMEDLYDINENDEINITSEEKLDLLEMKNFLFNETKKICDFDIKVNEMNDSIVQLTTLVKRSVVSQEESSPKFDLLINAYDEFIKSQYQSPQVFSLFSYHSQPSEFTDVFVEVSIEMFREHSFNSDVQEEKKDNDEKESDNNEENDDDDVEVLDLNHVIEKLFHKKNPSNIYESNHQFNIIGVAGIGKTMFCKYITYLWSTNQIKASDFSFVFFISLESFINILGEHSKSNRSIAEMLYLYYFKIHDIELNDVRDFWNLNKHNILFILDGDDKVATDGYSTRTMDNILKYIPNYVLTTRPSKTRKLYNDDQKYIINGFDDKGIEQFVKSYCLRSNRREDNEAEFTLNNFDTKLLNFIRDDITIRNMAKNPHWLELICFHAITDSNDHENNLKFTLFEIYDHLVEVMYRNVVQDEIGDKTKDYQDLLHFIQYLAFEARSQNIAVINSSNLQECLKKWCDYNDLEEIKSFLKLNVGKFGFLTILLGLIEGEPDWKFVDEGIQGYLASCYIGNNLATLTLASQRSQPLSPTKFLRMISDTSNNTEEEKEYEGNIKKLFKRRKFNPAFTGIIRFTSGYLSKHSQWEEIEKLIHVIKSPPVDRLGLQELRLLFYVMEETKWNDNIRSKESILILCKNWLYKSNEKHLFVEQLKDILNGCPQGTRLLKNIIHDEGIDLMLFDMMDEENIFQTLHGAMEGLSLSFEWQYKQRMQKFDFEQFERLSMKYKYKIMERICNILNSNQRMNRYYGLKLIQRINLNQFSGEEFEYITRKTFEMFNDSWDRNRKLSQKIMIGIQKDAFKFINKNEFLEMMIQRLEHDNWKVEMRSLLLLGTCTYEFNEEERNQFLNKIIKCLKRGNEKIKICALKALEGLRNQLISSDNLGDAVGKIIRFSNVDSNRVKKVCGDLFISLSQTIPVADLNRLLEILLNMIPPANEGVQTLIIKIIGYFDFSRVSTRWKTFTLNYLIGLSETLALQSSLLESLKIISMKIPIHFTYCYNILMTNCNDENTHKALFSVNVLGLFRFEEDYLTLEQMEGVRDLLEEKWATNDEAAQCAVLATYSSFNFDYFPEWRVVVANRCIELFENISECELATFAVVCFNAIGVKQLNNSDKTRLLLSLSVLLKRNNSLVLNKKTILLRHHIISSLNAIEINILETNEIQFLMDLVLSNCNVFYHQAPTEALKNDITSGWMWLGYVFLPQIFVSWTTLKIVFAGTMELLRGNGTAESLRKSCVHLLGYIDISGLPEDLKFRIVEQVIKRFDDKSKHVREDARVAFAKLDINSLTSESKEIVIRQLINNCKGTGKPNLMALSLLSLPLFHFDKLPQETASDIINTIISHCNNNVSIIKKAAIKSFNSMESSFKVLINSYRYQIIGINYKQGFRKLLCDHLCKINGACYVKKRGDQKYLIYYLNNQKHSIPFNSSSQLTEQIESFNLGKSFNSTGIL